MPWAYRRKAGYKCDIITIVISDNEVLNKGIYLGNICKHSVKVELIDSICHSKPSLNQSETNSHLSTCLFLVANHLQELAVKMLTHKFLALIKANWKN